MSSIAVSRNEPLPRIRTVRSGSNGAVYRLRHALKLVATVLGLFGASIAFAATSLLNVSYDPTRELYQDFNAAFARYWQASAKEKVSIRNSHGGSGRQAR